MSEVVSLQLGGCLAPASCVAPADTGRSAACHRIQTWQCEILDRCSVIVQYNTILPDQKHQRSIVSNLESERDLACQMGSAGGRAVFAADTTRYDTTRMGRPDACVVQYNTNTALYRCAMSSKSLLIVV